MIRVNKKDYTDARKRIRKFIKANKRLPNYCMMKTSEGKEIKMKPNEYAGLFEMYMVYCLKNGREPAYLTHNSNANNPLVLNYQDDKYSCCPASFMMCMMFLYEYKSEANIKKTLGTSTDGTSPKKLIEGAKKLGYKVTRLPREFKYVKKALNEYKPVMMHIETKPSKCLGYVNNYGHWIMCYKTGNNTYYIADPTMGLKKCNFQDINRATNGRTLYYYSVEIL